MYTFTIVTTDASKQLDWLHDRMPVILPDSASLAAWLDTSSQTWTSSAARLVKSYPLPLPSPSSKAKAPEFGDLECYAVPTEVGKVGAESATFVEPVQKRRDGIEAMFAKAKRVGKTSEGSGNGAIKVKTDTGGVDAEEPKMSVKRKREASKEENGMQENEKERELSVELLDVPPSQAKKQRQTAERPGSIDDVSLFD